jgi:hypothetical protein
MGYCEYCVVAQAIELHKKLLMSLLASDSSQEDLATRTRRVSMAVTDAKPSQSASGVPGGKRSQLLLAVIEKECVELELSRISLQVCAAGTVRYQRTTCGNVGSGLCAVQCSRVLRRPCALSGSDGVTPAALARPDSHGSVQSV